MLTKLEDRELLRRFLLRDVSEQEQDEVEELYFNDPEFLERLHVAEEELVDDYQRGDLSLREREKFERQYSANGVNRREVVFSRELHQALAEMSPPEPSESWWRRVSNYLFPRRMAVMAWVSLAALLLAVGLTWRYLRGPSAAEESARLNPSGPAAGEQVRPPVVVPPTSPADSNTAEGLPKGRGEGDRPEDTTSRGHEQQAGTKPQPTRPKPRAPATEPRTVPQPPYQVSLHSGVTLGAPSNAPPPLIIARGAKRVRLRIQVVKNEYREYHVSLQAVGAGRVWRLTTPKGQTDASGEWVSISVPVSVFKGKDYILRVSADAPGGRTETLALRQLQVERGN